MSQLLKDFIKSEIHPMMKELGYRKKANYFWRKNDVFVFTINFQSSQWNFEGRDEFYINCGVYSFEVAKANGEETDFSKLTMSDLLLVQYNDRQHYFTTHHHFSSFMLTDTADVSETGRLVREELKMVLSFFNSLTDNRKLLDWFMKEKVWVHHNKFLIYAFQQGYWDYVDYFIKDKKLNYEKENDSDYEIEENGLKIVHKAIRIWPRLAKEYQELYKKYHHQLDFEL